MRTLMLIAALLASAALGACSHLPDPCPYSASCGWKAGE